MYFDLTESIKDSILNAMDDQTSDLVFDSKSRSVVESDQNTTNNEQYIDLPKWTSADGFKIRQDFVSCLHAPLAKDELQQILHSGRGVFRNFKSCLKQYPEIEKKWHLFKRRKMLLKVNEWYNALRELWGLEALEAEPEDFEDLVQNDFIFRGYDSAKDKESVLHYANVEEVCIDENLEEVSAAIKFLWERQFLSQDSDFGLVSKTFSDDFAGCITFQACTSSSTKAVVLSAFFVLKNFRGLGIGRMLLSQSLELLRKRKIQCAAAIPLWLIWQRYPIAPT